MAPNGLQEWKNRAVKSLVSTVLLLSFAVSPAAATHGTLECTPPDSLMPLFELMHSLIELASIAGVLVGTVGFMAAGIMHMIPGLKWSEKGRAVAKHVFIGVVMLLSARMVIGFLVNEMGGVICG